MIHLFDNSSISRVQHGDEFYIIETVKDKHTDQFVVWHDVNKDRQQTYLCGTVVVDHEQRSIDTSQQVTLDDFVESNEVYSDDLDDLTLIKWLT